ncbi:MAG TPA: hypothetical protein VLJ39_03405 [Tepidisphaeraceae bacterium]|nr:hypothetical protein [Tepidisphaeraceae bacterium]
MRNIRLFACLVLAGALLVLSVGRPAVSGAPGRPNPERELENKPLKTAQPVSDAEWSEIEKWMATNCPNQLNFMKELNDKNGQQEHARHLIAQRYRAWNRAADAATKDAMLAQVRANDEIFGYQILFKQVKADRNRRHEVREKLRTAVRHLIDAQLAEKNARIAKLQQEVATLQSTKDKATDQYTDTLLHEVGSRLRPGGPPTTDVSSSTQAGPPSLASP